MTCHDQVWRVNTKLFSLNNINISTTLLSKIAKPNFVPILKPKVSNQVKLDHRERLGNRQHSFKQLVFDWFYVSFANSKEAYSTPKGAIIMDNQHIHHFIHVIQGINHPMYDEYSIYYT